MISDSELSSLLGKHIGLYPFIDRNVEGASIFLTASEFAWAKNEQNQVISIIKNNVITIPPKVTGIILTAEAISLDGWVAGICISRVSQTVKDLILPSTPIKPGWTGRLIITVYNTSNSPINITIGERIAVVMFSKLKKQVVSDDTRTSRADILSYIGVQVPQDQADALKEALNNRNYINRKYLIEAMKRSDDYLAFKARMKKKKNPVCIFFILCLLLFVASTICYFIQKNAENDVGYSTALITVFLTATISLAFKIWLE